MSDDIIMPRVNSILSAEEDPYTMRRYPQAYQVVVGRQAHDARQLARAANAKGGRYLDMYRQPIAANTIREIKRIRALAAQELKRRREIERIRALGVHELKRRRELSSTARALSTFRSRKTRLYGAPRRPPQ